MHQLIFARYLIFIYGLKCHFSCCILILRTLLRPPLSDGGLLAKYVFFIVKSVNESVCDASV